LGFSASTRQFADITIVDVRGRFTLIEGEAVYDLLLDLLRDGRRKILLNLREVSYLDSSGLGQLVRSLYTAQKHGGELRAVELNPRAREVMQVTNLRELFPDYPDEQAALNSFSAPF
jgi:anti-sigma B factor antagonist